jgi:hypothetical protein
MAMIIAVSTEAMTLFHSKDDIGALPLPFFGAVTVPRQGLAAANRIPPGGSTQLSRFRQWREPGILSLPDHAQ